MKTDKKRYGVLALGGAIGLVAAFLQTIEKLALIENKDAALPCNLNAVFSCSTVLSAPQSSLFGFPNSLICIVVFTVFLAVGLLGLAGSRIPAKARYVVQALAVFMALFALWFLFTSTFVIGSVCLFCLFCFAGLLFINGALWRLNFSAPSQGGMAGVLYAIRANNFDILLWLSLAVIVFAAIMLKFSLLT